MSVDFVLWVVWTDIPGIIVTLTAKLGTTVKTVHCLVRHMRTCRHTDGLCTCKAGWMGDNCTTECIQSYGENCQHPCSKHCSNHQCDRFNGKCLCDCQCGTDSLLRFHTNDAGDCKIWIVAFSLSLVTSVIFISVTIILRRKLSLQQKSSADDVNLYWRCGSNTEQKITTDDASHYQDLCVSRNEKTYQTIDQQ